MDKPKKLVGPKGTECNPGVRYKTKGKSKAQVQVRIK